MGLLHFPILHCKPEDEEKDTPTMTAMVPVMARPADADYKCTRPKFFTADAAAKLAAVPSSALFKFMTGTGWRPHS